MKIKENVTGQLTEGNSGRVREFASMLSGYTARAYDEIKGKQKDNNIAWDEVQKNLRDAYIAVEKARRLLLDLD